MNRKGAHTRIFVILFAATLFGLLVLPNFKSSARIANRLAKQTPQDPVSADGLGPNIIPANVYRQTNLVSDIPNLGQIIDPNLVNPWGLSMSATSPFWVANNVTSTATLYGGDIGSAPAFKNPLVVTI